MIAQDAGIALAAPSIMYLDAPVYTYGASRYVYLTGRGAGIALAPPLHDTPRIRSVYPAGTRRAVRVDTALPVRHGICIQWVSYREGGARLDTGGYIATPGPIE